MPYVQVNADAINSGERRQGSGDGSGLAKRGALRHDGTMEQEGSRRDDCPDADVVRCEIEGTRLEVLENGPQLLDALLDLISGARTSLRLFYYIFATDESGTQVRDALIEACHRDVEVTLIIDAFGSSATPDSFFAPLREAGGRFARFGSHWSSRYLIRNHQKMAIADERRALIGGFNVANDYFGLPEDNCWHDLGLLLDGEQALPLTAWFDRLWQWTSGGRGRFRRLRAMVRAWKPGDGRYQWLIGGPTYRLSPWARRVRTDLVQARRVDMIAAYFSPGRAMLRHLSGAARRRSGPQEGVRLIVASRSDNGATVAAARWLYRRLVRWGVRVYEYQPCRLHMKLIVIDDATYIGSANFDMRSLFLNLELMLRIEDAALAERMRRFVDERTKASEAITPAWIARRNTPLGLLKGWISYLLVAVLDYTVTRKLNFKDRVVAVEQP